MTDRSNDKKLSPTSAARFLGVKESTLAHWRWSGRYKLPYTKLGGRVFYWQSDVEQLLERCTITFE